MPRYRVNVVATYTDTVVVEASGPEDARRVALEGAGAWDEYSHDIDPFLEIDGEPELETDQA